MNNICQIHGILLENILGSAELYWAFARFYQRGKIWKDEVSDVLVLQDSTETLFTFIAMQQEEIASTFWSCFN